ncbi:pathogenicity island protein [Staphylococcus shinii]|uniref:pathogenicity island protein n=1 Tax=Staphylococcus shinii TaxID=2912228 RepID=UPI00298F096C|nr:pathogenicity island protein [Staphylococcus shinii]MDW8563864.1 pathogenicity island protein [Staphylococcus shinii]
MNLEQKYKLSKVVKVLEKVLDEKGEDVFLSAIDRFHSITDYRYSDTAFYEHILKLVHKELFNIVSYLQFNTEEYAVINEVVNTLHDVMNETREIYSYSITDGIKETEHTTDREGHIIGILEWALEYIVGNIEVEEME